MPRFSIRQLLAATAIVGLGCLALLKSSALLAAAMMSAVALMFVAAVILAIYSSGQKRAFWTGVTIFGWSYLLLCYGPIFTASNSPFGGSSLVTAQLAGALYDRIHGLTNGVQHTLAFTATVDPFAPPPIAPTVSVPQPVIPQPVPGAPFTFQFVTRSDRAEFLNVAHSLWAALIALGGGWFAAWASRRQQRIQSNQASADPQPG